MYKHEGIVIRPLPLDDLMVVSSDDSSWANAPGLKSQKGLLVTVTSTAAREGRADASPVVWKSHRSKRMLRSALAAKADAAEDAADHVYMTAAHLSELPYDQSALDRYSSIPLHVVIDCRSLYDACQKDTPKIEEKRTLIDVLNLRLNLRKDGLRRILSGTRAQAKEGGVASVYMGETT